MIDSCRKKCTLVLLFLLLMGAARVSAQQLVEEHFEQTPLDQVFDLFSSKYGLLLNYDPSICEGQVVNLLVQEGDVLRAFYRVLDNAQLEYLTLDHNRILIRPASATPAPLSYWKVSGLITDAATGEPLPFASVHCAQYGWGDSADADGRYQILIPDTISHSLLFESRYLGYSSSAIRVTTGAHRQLNFELAASTQEIGMVVVIEELPTFSINLQEQGLVVRPDEQLPALGISNDLMRTLQLLPGVSASNDRSAALQVRGSQATDNLIMWDGMLLYNVDHLFGAFGAVNGNLVESATLYKNTFPIEYAGRSASVLQIRSFGQEAPSSTSLQLGNLVAEGASRLSLNDRWQLQIGGRSSLNRLVNTDLFGQLSQQVDLNGANLNEALQESQQVQIQPAFNFYDLNGKLSWQASKNTYIDLNAFGSSDQYDYDYALVFNTRLPNRLGSNTLRFTEESKWANQAFSGRWRQQWSENWKSELTLGYSQYQETEWSSTTLERERPDTEISAVSRVNQRSNQVTGYHANWTHTYTRPSGHTLTFGTRLTDEQVQLAISNDSLNLLLNEAQATQLGVFAAHNWQWEQWQLQLGVHGTYYDGTDNIYASPRLLLGFRANDKWYLKGSLNLYHQYLRRYYSENRFGRSFQIWTLADDQTWPVSQTQQGMLGFTYRNGSFSLDVEGFHKFTKGVLEYTTLLNNIEETETGGVAGGQNTFRLSEGTGQVSGIDILLRQEWKKLRSNLSYTYSRSTRQFSDLFRGQTYASQDDRPHQLQWSNSWHNEHWAFSGVYVMASGRPYFDLLDSNFASDRRNRSPDNLRRIRSYHRVDLSARYSFALGKASAHAALSVFNLLNRDNTLYEQQIYAIPSQDNRNLLLGNELQLLERTWSFSVGMEF